FLYHPTATTPISTLSLHDALPISRKAHERFTVALASDDDLGSLADPAHQPFPFRSSGHAARIEDDDYSGTASQLCPVTEPRSQRSEEHTSELQSRFDLVCRLLLEK